MGPDAVPKSLARFFKRQNIYINKSIQIYSGRKKKKRGEQYAESVGRDINLPASRAS